MPLTSALFAGDAVVVAVEVVFAIVPRAAFVPTFWLFRG
jgi:hypothetical protein